MVIISVHRDDVLSRTMIFRQPFIVGHTEFYSIEQMARSIMMTQHRLFGLVDRFWSDHPEYVGAPEHIGNRVENLLASYNIPIDPLWVFEKTNAYVSAMCALLEDGYNDFAREMHRIYQTAGLEVEFISVGGVNDLFWNSGYGSRRHISGESQLPGNNQYGVFLITAYQAWFPYMEHPSARAVPPFQQYLSNYVMRPRSYLKTVLVLSDSLARTISSIEGGSVWYQTGITCSQMAADLRSKFANLFAFRYIIIFVGTNDSILPVDQQEQGWKRLREVLLPLKDHPETSVIFNTGIGLPAWPFVPAYTGWFRAKFAEDFNCANFVLCDWSIPSAPNCFLNEDGLPNEIFLNVKRDHPNEKGIRRMWGYFKSQLGTRFEDLGLVRITLTGEFYRAGMMSDRVRLE